MTAPIDDCCNGCCPLPERALTSLEKLVRMANDPLSNALAKEHGLNIQTVSWEDTARFKNSCWGPNISDMTLQVKDRQGNYQRMPVIRQPNFADKTHDVPLDRFSVLFGNETGANTLTRLPLKEYLEHFSKTGNVKGSLLAETDTHVIHSVQACFLPASKGEEVNFNVALFNYQSYAGNPAVLTLVVSNQGTSAQIIDNGNAFGGQRLSFDKNGMSCDFVAKRLQDVRANAGRINEGPLNAEEIANRKLLIIQIPLKVTPRPPLQYAMFGLESCCTTNKCCATSIDDAQISIGKEEGEFAGLKGLSIERDERFPIRVTTQLYKISDAGEINRKQMDAIAAEIKAEESIGEKGSSLVLEETDRPTEWSAKQSMKVFLFNYLPARLQPYFGQS